MQPPGTDTLWLGVFAGLCGALVLYHLFLYISLRDQAYALFVGLVSCVATPLLGLPLHEVVGGPSWVSSVAGSPLLLLGASLAGVGLARQLCRGDTSPFYLVLGFGPLIGGIGLQQLAVALSSMHMWGLSLAGAGVLVLALAIAERFQVLRAEQQSSHRHAMDMERRALEHELRVSQGLRSLRERVVRHLMDAQEQERAYLAAELHDGLGQRLLLVKNATRRAISQLQAPLEGAGSNVHSQLEQVDRLAQDSIDEARSISHGLHPHQLRSLGLKRAVEATAEALCVEHEVVIETDVDDRVDALVGEGGIHMYRIIQEALNNAFQHGGARYAEVSVRVEDGAVDLSVSDDGGGFLVPENLALGHVDSLGLSEMFERARILGGSLAVQSSADEGTEVSVHIAPGASLEAARPSVAAVEELSGNRTAT